jgi:hypothetical protein
MSGMLATVFADISLAQLGLIAVIAVLASVIGGVAGYGTGALMPLVPLLRALQFHCAMMSHIEISASAI